MVWGAPLRFTLSWIEQRSCVRIMSLLCPPPQSLGPMRIQWDTGYSPNSQNSRQGILKSDSQVNMVFLILDFYGVWGKIHGYVVAISSEVIFYNDYWNQKLDFEAKQSKDRFWILQGGRSPLDLLCSSVLQKETSWAAGKVAEMKCSAFKSCTNLIFALPWHLRCVSIVILLCWGTEK